MDAITICAANYLPFAHVLGNSYLANNPNDSFSILIIDANQIEFKRLDQFKYFSPTDLDLDEKIFNNMTLYYTVTELATALKPSALKMLFRNGCDQVIYLDPDIQVFGHFSELKTLVNENSIVLTPHNLQPLPRDGLRPTEADILSSGTFNLGFIGMSKSVNSLQMLDWWEERLRFDSISDPAEMLFTDQRWVDLVPSYFDFKLLTHPGYNLAYWNLHERVLSEKNNQTLVNDKDLKFFHFSGYRPETPWILSKYVANKPRVVISSNKVLGKLCSQYSDKLISAGWTKEGDVEYGYSKLTSGREIPCSLRRLYREDCIAAFNKGEVLEPPKDWQTWATSKSIESGNLSRILFSLWKSRPDLQRRFPDATGSESEFLQAWAIKHGVPEKVIDADLIEIRNLEGDNWSDPAPNKCDITVAGYLKGEFGLGQSSRLILSAAEATGVKVSILNSNRSFSRQNETIGEFVNKGISSFVISIVNADQFALWVTDVGLNNLKSKTIVGVWAWETEDFPKEMHKAFDQVDEIWAVSNFVKDAIQKHTNKPVLVFPTPISKSEKIEILDRSAIGLPENAIYNLFIFDYLSVFNRKNPLGVVKAHIKAFPDAAGPLLVLKSTNGDLDAINREKLRFEVQNRKDILLIEDYLSRAQLTSLINECCTYISLHRSEGYGLTMAEAMALGKPVVATGYSGNLDFMDSSTAKLIPYELVKVGNFSFPYLPDSKWAEPDIDSAAHAISNLYKDENLRLQIGNSAANITNKFTIERSADFISKRFHYHRTPKAKLNKYMFKVLKIKAKLTKIIKATYRLTLKIIKE